MTLSSLTLPVRPSMSLEEIRSHPFIQAVIANPLNRVFLPEDLFLLVLKGEPQRVMRVHISAITRFTGTVVPPVAGPSYIWLPTAEQLIERLLQTRESIEFTATKDGRWLVSLYQLAAHNLEVAA